MKSMTRVARVRDLAEAIVHAVREAKEGVPGPNMDIPAVVFTVHKAGEDILVDSPLDLLGWDFF